MLFGAERGNLEALCSLKSQGATLLCLIRDESWSTIVPAALDARGIAWRKVPYVEQWRPSRAHVVIFRSAWAFVVANWRFLAAVRDFRPTHVHAYGQLFVLNFLAGMMLVRTPLVFRAGDEPTLHNKFWRMTWRYVVNRTSMFVANSRFVGRSLIDSGVPVQRVTLIYNAPPSRPRRDGEVFYAPPAGRLVAYVGQIAEHKGPHLLVEAFKGLASEFPDIHLVVAGRISEWQGDAWARALRDRTLSDPELINRVSFIGQVEDIPGVLAASAFAVVPSVFNDPSPNVVTETKQAGRAVIGFPRGGIPELIEHDVDGLVCSQVSVIALQIAMHRYLADPSLVEKHGAAALRSLDRLGVPEFGRRWRAVYEIGSSSDSRPAPMGAR